MAIALVGSLGTVATGTTSVAPSFPQSTTAGNCLVYWVISTGGSLPASAPTGWSTARRSSNALAAIYYKANCGAGESAPAAVTGATFMAGQLAEFSGIVTTSALGDSGASVTTTSPNAVAAVAADAAAGYLVLGASAYLLTMSATVTDSHAYNNGGTALNNANNNGTSTASHYLFSYAITTSNAAADQFTDTFTGTISARGAVLGSLVAAAGGGGGNPDFSPFGQTGFYGA